MVSGSDTLGEPSLLGLRLATSKDLPQVELMIRRYLAEAEKASPRVRLNRRSVDRYRDLALAYVRGSLAGVVVIAGTEKPVGLAMGGEDLGQPYLDGGWGRTATVWIAWVAPEARQSGLALKMLYWGLPHLVELGFDTALMGVLETNTAGRALTEAFGAQLTERLYAYPLKEKPHGGIRR